MRHDYHNLPLFDERRIVEHLQKDLDDIGIVLHHRGQMITWKVIRLATFSFIFKGHPKIEQWLSIISPFFFLAQKSCAFTWETWSWYCLFALNKHLSGRCLSFRYKIWPVKLHSNNRDLNFWDFQMNVHIRRKEKKSSHSNKHTDMSCRDLWNREHSLKFENFQIDQCTFYGDFNWCMCCKVSLKFGS